MNFDIDSKTNAEIAEAIHSDDSPVGLPAGQAGIDAKKTHILILNKLQEKSDRLLKLEQQMPAK